MMVVSSITNHDCAFNFHHLNALALYFGPDADTQARLSPDHQLPFFNINFYLTLIRLRFMCVCTCVYICTYILLYE